MLDRLEGLQNEINAIEVQQDGQGEALISDEDQRAIANYRAEILSTRKELREVQRALREDIDRLESFTKFTNIAGIPILFGILMVCISVWRRRQAASAAA